MSKKIVVITGSPRKTGNSFAMTQAFIDAAKAEGHIITRFDAAFKKLGGCHACETCFKSGKACSFDDDFNELAPYILEADAVVFTTPVYWYSYPSQIKAVIDKLYALCVGGKVVAGKECALITCCEEDDMSVLDGVRVPYERMAALLKWKSVGEVLVPGVLNAGDIEKTDGCEKAKASYEESCKRHKDQYEHDKTQFEENRKKDMESVISGGREKKGEIESLQKRIGEIGTKIDSLGGKRRIAEESLEKAKSEYAAIPSQADVTGLDDYKEITDKIQKLECEIEELSKPSAEQEELKAKKADLQNEISDIEAQIKAADNSQIKSRIAELEEEKSQVAQKVAEQEQMIDLTESFIRAKMQMISQKINEKFEVVSWKLFENQINGGLKETCECTVNGVPYSSLNDGHKIVAGLDIIKSMSNLHNVSAPIFIDNAESINEYNIPDTGAQMIFLRVTDDKSLVIEGADV